MRQPRPLPDELLALARVQHGALTGTQVRGGVGERGLRRAVGKGHLIRLWQGGYALPGRVSCVDATVSDSATEHSVSAVTRLSAAELTLRRPVTACLHTAAELYGFAIDPDSRTHVIGAAPSLRPELAVHRTPPHTPTNRTHGFEVVGVAETAVRLAALAPNAPRSLAVLDAALRTNYTSAALLQEAANRIHIDGVGQIRSLLALADRRAESPPESWLRWVCHDAGFPPPVPQFWVQCRNRAWYRLDLAWPTIKLGLEYDGVGVHTGAALTRDRQRLSALNRAGWTIHSVTAPMLWEGRDAFVADISADLRLRGEL